MGKHGVITVKQAAQLMNVKERNLYYLKKVCRLCVPEVIEAIEQDNLSIHAATQFAELPPDLQKELVRLPKKKILEILRESRP